MRGGGRGTFERRRRELREEEEGLLRGGGRGSYERRRKRKLREEEEEGLLRGGTPSSSSFSSF